MNARIFKEDKSEEMLVSSIMKESEWFIGKLDSILCSGATLALFRRLEDAASQNLVHDAESAESEIRALNFFVIIDQAEARRCKVVQLMNGNDVSFKLEA